jgi:hypothetical protein
MAAKIRGHTLGYTLGLNKAVGMPTYKVRYAHIRASVSGAHVVAGRRVHARHNALATPTYRHGRSQLIVRQSRAPRCFMETQAADSTAPVDL